MNFPDIAAKPALTAESRGGFLLPQTRGLTGTLNIACWTLKFVFKKYKV